MTLAAIRALFRPGQVVTVTNHYLTRPDHPCYGTQTRTVARVTTTGLWFTESGRVAWPKAAQIAVVDGTVRLFGGGGGQQPGDPFLTIRLERPDGEACEACGESYQADNSDAKRFAHFCSVECEHDAAKEN